MWVRIPQNALFVILQDINQRETGVFTVNFSSDCMSHFHTSQLHGCRGSDPCTLSHAQGLTTMILSIIAMRGQGYKTDISTAVLEEPLQSYGVPI